MFAASYRDTVLVKPPYCPPPTTVTPLAVQEVALKQACHLIPIFMCTLVGKKVFFERVQLSNLDDAKRQGRCFRLLKPESTWFYGLRPG